MTADTSRTRRGKVERLLAAYDMGEVGEELVAAWTGEGRERRSLRELARYFNEQLIEQVLTEHAATAVGADPGTVLDRLREDSVSTAVRNRTRRQLEREGVDVDELESAFVSHSAIQTFLRHRGASREEPDTDQVAVEAGHIQGLRNRTVTVVEDKVSSLRSTDRIDVGSFNVIVDVQVYCEDCQTGMDVDDLLEAGGCSCPGA